MRTEKIIDEVNSLPIEKRALIVDSILQSLNPIEAEIEKVWIQLAKKRLASLEKGRVKLIEGENVFKKIWKNYSE